MVTTYIFSSKQLTVACVLPPPQITASEEDEVSHDRNVKKMLEEYTKPNPSLNLIAKLMAITFDRRRD